MSEKEIAIVTGASSGIGAATSRLLAQNGYHVIAAARRTDRLKELADEDSNIEIFELDITSQEHVDSLAKHVSGKPVSILVNNAGGAFDSKEILSADPESWSKTYELNVVGTVRMVKAITPIMEKFGFGHIVIVASTAGHATYENGGSYVAAKHAERTVAETLRLELNSRPIRVTEISPGMVKTDEFAKNRFAGDVAKAQKVYEGVDLPLTDFDIAETIRWSVMLPAHVNIDSMIIRPLAQAANHKVHRTT